MTRRGKAWLFNRTQDGTAQNEETDDKLAYGLLELSLDGLKKSEKDEKINFGNIL